MILNDLEIAEQQLITLSGTNLSLPGVLVRVCQWCREKWSITAQRTTYRHQRPPRAIFSMIHVTKWVSYFQLLQNENSLNRNGSTFIILLLCQLVYILQKKESSTSNDSTYQQWLHLSKPQPALTKLIALNRLSTLLKTTTRYQRLVSILLVIFTHEDL